MLGGDGLNLLSPQASGAIDCACFGPDQVGTAAANRLERFEGEQGWLVLVFHGLDDEGWGPVAGNELEALVDSALAIGAIVAPPSRLLLRRA